MKYSEQDELWIPAGYGQQLTLPAAPSEGQLVDQLARGESVPGGPGACTRPGCGHAKVWHNPGNRVHECERCECGRFAR